MQNYAWLKLLVKYLGVATIADYISELIIAFDDYIQKGDFSKPFEFFVCLIDGLDDVKCGLKVELEREVVKITAHSLMPQHNMLFNYQNGSYPRYANVSFSTPEYSEIDAGVLRLHVLRFEARCG